MDHFNECVVVIECLSWMQLLKALTVFGLGVIELWGAIRLDSPSG